MKLNKYTHHHGIVKFKHNRRFLKCTWMVEQNSFRVEAHIAWQVVFNCSIHRSLHPTYIHCKRFITTDTMNCVMSHGVSNAIFHFHFFGWYLFVFRKKYCYHMQIKSWSGKKWLDIFFLNYEFISLKHCFTRKFIGLINDAKMLIRNRIQTMSEAKKKIGFS